jgi:hypothetical protein
VLRQAGVAASVLPVFSNIPVIRTRRQSGHGLKGVHFGGFAPLAKVDRWQTRGLLRFFEELATVAHERAITPEFTLVGRQSRSSLNAYASIEEVVKGRIDIKIAGELTPSDVSEQLADADFGLVTTPRCLLGKSGGAAAMQSHGLPIIAPYNGYWPRAMPRTEDGSAQVSLMDYLNGCEIVPLDRPSPCEVLLATVLS